MDWREYKILHCIFPASHLSVGACITSDGFSVGFCNSNVLLFQPERVQSNHTFYNSHDIPREIHHIAYRIHHFIAAMPSWGYCAKTIGVVDFLPRSLVIG